MLGLYVFCVVFVFFFKQKTAYEMRISDWSSDVCSSDLPEKTAATMREGGVLTGDKFYQDQDGNYFYVGRNDDMLRAGGIWVSPAEIENTLLERSEEHTSELQSLMRISYAVFCLKKKRNKSERRRRSHNRKKESIH